MSQDSPNIFVDVTLLFFIRKSRHSHLYRNLYLFCLIFIKKCYFHRVKPLMNGLREANTLMELDRDERKLEVFLSFHRASLTAADLKIFLPFTINLDPYIKKVIKGNSLYYFIMSRTNFPFFFIRLPGRDRY